MPKTSGENHPLRGHKLPDSLPSARNELPQSEAKRFLPPNSYLWRLNTRGAWGVTVGMHHDHVETWARHGNDSAKAMWACVRFAWKLWLEDEALPEEHSPFKGLLSEWGSFLEPREVAPFPGAIFQDSKYVMWQLIFEYATSIMVVARLSVSLALGITWALPKALHVEGILADYLRVRLGSLSYLVCLRRRLGSDLSSLLISWRSPAVKEKEKLVWKGIVGCMFLPPHDWDTFSISQKRAGPPKVSHEAPPRK